VIDEERIGDKSHKTALMLCIFFGIYGFHSFYARKYSTGFLQAFTLGGFGIWTLVDLIAIYKGSFVDSKGKFLNRF